MGVCAADALGVPVEFKGLDYDSIMKNFHGKK
jgi:ADP-ribosylglycohydrolase